jgi:hypothetical protein
VGDNKTKERKPQESEALLGPLILLIGYNGLSWRLWDPYRNGSKRFLGLYNGFQWYKVLLGVLEAPNTQILGNISL